MINTLKRFLKNHVHIEGLRKFKIRLEIKQFIVMSLSAIVLNYSKNPVNSAISSSPTSLNIASKNRTSIQY